MKLYENGFIGHDVSNITTNWISGDTEEAFKNNCERMPSNWYYKNANVTYRINSNGHRSKNISDVDLANYILCIGCSHTEGVGVEEEKSYPCVLAKKLNCDYYSMGLGATGIDVVLHNLIVWFSIVSQKPKAVVIQWPDFTRILTGSSPTNLRPSGWWTNDSDFGKFVNLAIDLEYFEAKKILTHALVQTIVKVPIVYFGLQKVVPFNNNMVIEKIVDHARDLGHPGIKSHEIFANSIYDHLINN